ncbi:hypothetical protein [Paraferrimonas haliotis]|uniref:Uncharacterized protein n=1 Tax=Paraferrimonas haliotis TaxID=2013866 RepID=A0AA37TXL2_9GAMM|nr:hypothetical protein [Paraferrimonas haliotis]GLS83246.1 hypothetical protein GCM10007894_12230 [Paraferrimonas haliotis]
MTNFLSKLLSAGTREVNLDKYEIKILEVTNNKIVFDEKSLWKSKEVQKQFAAIEEEFGLKPAKASDS